MQVGEADGELARAFSGIQEKYPEQDMKWAEMRDRIIEDLYGLITRSQESADFAVSEVANIQYQQEKNKNSNMEKKQVGGVGTYPFQEKEGAVPALPGEVFLPQAGLQQLQDPLTRRRDAMQLR